MDEHIPDDLTDAERAALEALPRERMPDPLLEDRTVRALRARGVIRSAPGPRFPASWRLAAVAAGLALFTSGVAIGQWSGSRDAARVIASLERDGVLQSAAQVQRTGTAYVDALADLVAVTDSANAADAEQAREVALAALWAAATEIVRLAPDDPVAGQIVHAFEQARADRRPDAGARQVLWF
jgi:hypothetical protein